MVKNSSYLREAKTDTWEKFSWAQYIEQRSE